MSLQRLEPKFFRKRGNNGVSTPHVLSMRQYAHKIEKHAKKGHLDHDQAKPHNLTQSSSPNKKP